MMNFSPLLVEVIQKFPKEKSCKFIFTLDDEGLKELLDVLNHYEEELQRFKSSSTGGSRNTMKITATTSKFGQAKKTIEADFATDAIPSAIDFMRTANSIGVDQTFIPPDKHLPPAPPNGAHIDSPTSGLDKSKEVPEQQTKKTSIKNSPVPIPETIEDFFNDYTLRKEKIPNKVLLVSYYWLKFLEKKSFTTNDFQDTNVCRLINCKKENTPSKLSSLCTDGFLRSFEKDDNGRIKYELIAKGTETVEKILIDKHSQKK